ncbi:MAG: hypothetical protein Q7R30_12345 [Acidobacteriota bacterium]|nr:hypothetical protein [Acidobacteriota bacterium]
MIRQTFAVTVAFSLFLSGCASGRFGPDPDTEAPKGPRTLKKLSVAERQALLQRAQVWQAVNTSSLNLARGPVLPAPLRVGPAVACAFVFPDKPLTGMTPKFLCELKKDDVVKVKYGEKNGEVYAEVAASRLLWALGFRADTMEPTRVTCNGCPADPFATSGADWQRGSPTDVSTKVFDPAIIERDVPGDPIETPGYEGWAWPELEAASQRAGGATRAQIDAFKLLAVFIQHSDTKPDQQEIVCTAGQRKDAKGNETCGSPWLVIKDLGGTFGKATLVNNSKMKLADWSGETVWKDSKQCIGNLPRSLTGNLDDPKISEAGRRFLAERLNRLTDRQLRDLFTVSNVMKRGETIDGADGKKRPVTVDDWVRVFKKKRAEITSARCAA